MCYVYIYVYTLIYISSINPSIHQLPIRLSSYIYFLSLSLSLCLSVHLSIYLPTYQPIDVSKELARAITGLPPARCKLREAVDGISTGV